MKPSVKLIGICAAIAVFSTELRADKPKTERKIDIPIPVGHDVKGLRLPVRNEQGKMQFQLDVQRARRIDQANIEMHMSVIQTYDEQTSEPSAKIEMIDSVMNTETNVVTSRDPVVISRDDFRLTGDGITFNTKTRQGKVIKNVRLIIYNRDDLMKKSPEQQPLPSEEKK